MSRKIIRVIKVVYKDIEFSVIPAQYFTRVEKLQMCQYIKNIGDTIFCVDNELYLDEGAFFNLSMKYIDIYDFI